MKCYLSAVERVKSMFKQNEQLIFKTCFNTKQTSINQNQQPFFAKSKDTVLNRRSPMQNEE